jgi:hypothetical protein
MKRVLTGVFVLSAVCAVPALAAGKEAAKPAAKPAAYVVQTPADLKWTELAKGVQRATVWGDPGKGDYGAFIKFAAGAEVGWHTHTNRVRLVAVSGALVVEPKGQPSRELLPGTFVDEPGMFVHRTNCKAGADCVFFIHQHGKFDLNPVEEKK